MQKRETNLRKEIVQTGKLLYQKGLIVATDGNISGRLSKSLYLITLAGFCKGKLKQHELVRMSTEGSPIPAQSKLKPSTEFQLHSALYNKRPEINAIIHAHPVYATALASAKTEVTTAAMNWFTRISEIRNTIGNIALIDSLPPGSKELAEAAAGAMIENNLGLMVNHGVVAVGEDLTHALYRLERIELATKLYLLTKLFNQIPG